MEYLSSEMLTAILGAHPDKGLRPVCSRWRDILDNLPDIGDSPVQKLPSALIRKHAGKVDWAAISRLKLSPEFAHAPWICAHAPWMHAYAPFAPEEPSDEYSFTATTTGAVVADVTLTCVRTGRVCQISWSLFSGPIVDSGPITLASGTIPPKFRPKHGPVKTFAQMTNGRDEWEVVRVELYTSGGGEIYSDLSYGTFSEDGEARIHTLSVFFYT